jgi:hypothetical protein
MRLRFMFLLTTWLAAWLPLARLILRHQLAVLQRQQPGSWSGSRGSVVLADHAAGHLAALHGRVGRRQDIRGLMLRLTREDLRPWRTQSRRVAGECRHRP